MPPPATPAGQSPAQTAAGQKAGQTPQDPPGTPKSAESINGPGKPPDGPTAAVRSLPAQIARPVLRSVLVTLGQAFRLSPDELREAVEGITDL